MQQLLVSILIPLYNSEKYIAETLQSVINQTWPNKEIIVVDDGSTDKSYEIAKSYESDIVKVYHQENRGSCAARNKAFELSSGDYIQYLDADDLLAHNKIEIQLNLLLEKQLNLSFCSWTKFFFNNPDGNLNWQPTLSEDEVITSLDWLLKTPNIACHAWLASRELIEKAGTWDTMLKKNQDGEFFTRVVSTTDKIIFCKMAKAYYRASVSDSITSNLAYEKIESSFLGCQSYENVLLSYGTSIDIRQAIANRYLWFCYVYGTRKYELFCQAFNKVKYYGGGNIRPFKRSFLNTLGQYIGYEKLIKIRDFSKLINHGYKA